MADIIGYLKNNPIPVLDILHSSTLVLADVSISQGMFLFRKIIQ